MDTDHASHFRGTGSPVYSREPFLFHLRPLLAFGKRV